MAEAAGPDHHACAARGQQRDRFLDRVVGGESGVGQRRYGCGSIAGRV